MFDDKAAFTAHYKSEWHRYNLKRRTAQLPMVSLEEFERRRAAAQEASPAPKGQAHVKANKREKRSKRRELKGASVVDSGSGYRSSLNVADGPASKPTEDINEESEEEEIEEVTAEARCTDSFFDNEQFQSSEEALAYMHRTYGFVLPESPYIADIDGLALYLCSKIKQGRTCMASSLDGARAGPLANTLFGAKHGGHCHRQSASTFPSFRRQMLRNS